jgi:hypothetical protein
LQLKILFLRFRLALVTRHRQLTILLLPVVLAAVLAAAAQAGTELLLLVSHQV